MALSEDASVGERIAYHRKRRGMSQSVLSGLLGRSEEWLSQIERGSRSVERLTTIVDVARVLRIEPSLLLPPPFFAKPRQVANNGTIGTAPEWVPAIRSAMMRRVGSTEDSDGRQVDAWTLSQDIQRGFGYSQTERWSDLGPLLPDLLHDVHWFVSHSETPDSLRLLSLTYRLASGMLDRIGEVHLPWIAAERASAAADRSGDPLLMAGAAWRWAVVLRHAGELEESHNVPMRAADALVDDIQSASPQALSVYGSLLLKGAVAAASLDDRQHVSEYLNRAQEVAEVAGEANHFWFAFGPTNVAIHRVWLDLELGDPTEAVRAADAVDTERLPAHLAERRASHLITVAWAQYLRRKDDLAIEALTEARVHAPEQLLFTRKVNDMLAGMLKRDRRNRRQLRALADFAGAT
ncbi:helix-turn-helix domain-containing protein [Kineosporia succinea]|uniref:Transcriptional regulator with XRE-family HTH domain n=1 Tax=Kineosporia succinea TaxID=84632 RepID=A0ABT9NXV0_9ACTN|nr:helix-turn-helix transcriptional regulator [Kineosporia succinea]MDP9825252.1 transcriptional regulator with XRE-family HTH domain [Kineosporia succinea]